MEHALLNVQLNAREIFLTVISLEIKKMHCVQYSNWKYSNTIVRAKSQRTYLEIMFALLQYSSGCVSYRQWRSYRQC
jgi:hypothetical protein